MSNDDVKFGLFVPATEVLGLASVTDPLAKCEAMFSTARKAEELGYDSLWVPDHLQQSGEGTIFECWMTIAALARETRTITLGQMATCVSFRSPALLAKMVATVDHMSNGRIIVGVGSGWSEAEHVAFDLDYGPSNGYRLARLKEGVEVMRAMWTQRHPSYDGRFYSIKDAVNEPKPLQKPYPPVWIAGVGERTTLRIVAELGDGCNVFGRPETVTRKLAALRGHCDDLGRDYDRIVKSSMVAMAVGDEQQQEQAYRLAAQYRIGGADAPQTGGRFFGTPKEASERLRQLVDCGITHFILNVPNIVTDGALEKLREIVDGVAG